MRTLLIALVVALVPPVSRAAPAVELPAGASWVVAAPDALRFARELSAFAAEAGRRSPSLSVESINREWKGTAGLPLLDVAALRESGVDVSKGWMLFSLRRSTYLSLSVKNGAALSAALEAWAAGRQLRGREEKPYGNTKGRVVTFSRSKGSRAAIGYVIHGDHALILTKSEERTPGLAQAFHAVDNASMVRPGVDGALVVTVPFSFAREVWFGLTPSKDGLAVKGAATQLSEGWLAPEASRGGWVEALMGEVAPESALRLRLLVGAKGADRIARLMTQASGPDDAAAAAALGKAAKGPVELWVEKVSTSAKGSGAAELLPAMFAPTAILPGRAAQLSAVTEAARKATGRFSVKASGDALLVSVGAASGAIAPEPTGGPRISCGKGAKPVFALRVDGASVSRSIGGVGLFGALRDETLMALYAVSTEYGGLLRELLPTTLLGCQSGNRVELTGRLTLRGG